MFGSSEVASARERIAQSASRAKVLEEKLLKAQHLGKEEFMRKVCLQKFPSQFDFPGTLKEQHGATWFPMQHSE